MSLNKINDKLDCIPHTQNDAHTEILQFVTYIIKQPTTVHAHILVLEPDPRFVSKGLVPRLAHIHLLGYISQFEQLSHPPILLHST